MAISGFALHSALRIVRLALAAGMLAACTTPTPSPPIDDAALRAERHRMMLIALDSWNERVRRVYLVSHRLLATASEKGWCRPVRPDRGLLIQTADDLPAGLAVEVLADGRQPPVRIVAVADASPAADAGLRADDALLAIDGEAVTPRHGPPDAWRGAQSVALTIADAEGQRTVRVASQAACALDIVMDPSHELSAETNARGVIHIAQGMVMALQDDDSLAFVIGHELGHRVHADSAWPGLLDAQASQDQERQADRFGLLLLAAAGYDPHRVADIWDRLARLDADHVGQNWLHDHPLRAERSLRLHEAIESGL